MTDWRDLPAGLALDRVIAETLGWTEIEKREVWVETGDWDGWETRLRGRETPDSIGNWDTIPQWSTNTDAAMKLLPQGLELRIDCIGWWNARFFNGSNYVMLAKGIGEVPALAVCRAYLDWKEKKAE